MIFQVANKAKFCISFGGFVPFEYFQFIYVSFASDFHLQKADFEMLEDGMSLLHHSDSVILIANYSYFSLVS